MQAKKRLSEVSVIQGLLDAPERFQFYQSLRILVRWLRHGGVPYDQALSQVLRFQNSLSMSFPASEIEALWAEPADCRSDIDLLRAVQGAGTKICLTPAFLGLLGANGTLPSHKTERVGAALRRDHESSARAFIDLFSQRMVGMFFEAWGKYRLEHRFDMGDQDAQLPLLRALAGHRDGALSDGAEHCVTDEVGGYYAALLRTRPVAASSVSRVLTHHFGMPVELEPFVEAWDDIPITKRSKLGGTVAKLGCGAALGQRLRRRDLRVRLNIGPLDPADAERVFPRSAAAVALEKMVSLFGLPNLRFEVRLLLKPPCVRRVALTSQPGLARRLGWDCFLPRHDGSVSRATVGYMLRPLDADAGAASDSRGLAAVRTTRSGHVAPERE